ncbi:SCO family protein [Aliifodinibius salicampi]|uniref:SCO family protein n=1 Tax=Fodinibius salicampi TaxID=1920655 RepID=A0ABT3PXG0_9BACT|nr:SCO family protein [Fodinibius salicampi]MCW9712549.1 SCO family protein [Fodinibius salicampi]
MKTYSYQSIGFFFAVVALLLGVCSSGEKQQTAQSQSGQMAMAGDEHAAHADMEMDAIEPTDESIYNVSSQWKNRHGEIVALDRLRGKVQLVAMVYTHCEHACPRILADMKRIRDNLSEEILSQTNFAIISIDPERDTPQRLTNFAYENNLSEDKWTLLNGDQGDVLEIAALLGVKYKRISDTDFTHSNMITVLNKEGEVVHQRKKLEDQHPRIIAAIEQAAGS